MSSLQIATAFAAILNGLLGMFVLLRAPQGRVQRAFACFALSISIWIFGILGVDTAVNPDRAFHGIVLAFIGGHLIAASIAWMASVFPGPGSKIPGIRLRLFVAVGVILAAISPTGCYISAMRMVGNEWEATNGPLLPAFSLYFCVATAYFIGAVAGRWRHSKGLERLQTQYLMLGSILTLTVGMATNVLAPLFLHTGRYHDIGPIGTLFFVFFSGYSIARFRLLDITWVIGRGLAYILTLGALCLTFIVSGVYADRIAVSYLGINSVTAQAVVAMLLAIIFQPVYQFFQKLVDILFFRRRYDYPRTLHRVSRAMTSVLDLHQLREQLEGSVIRFMQVEKASLATSRNGVWETSREDGFVRFAFGSPLLTTMRQGQIVLREEASQDEQNPLAQLIAANMRELEVDVAVPLLFKEELVGILFVGPRRSGTVFTDEDIALLSTLANQAAIALRNAQLYLEVRSSQQYTQAILEHLDSAVLTVGEDSVPIVVNEAARRLLPRMGGELAVPPILRDVVSRVFRTSQDEADLEFDLVGSGGALTPVIATVCPFVSDSGRVEAALIVIRDISVLRRLEDERLRADRLSSVSRVAAQLAHEIRNPLASIKTFCQLIPEKYMDVEFREGFAGIAFQEVERIDSLVRNLLSAEKPIEGARREVHLDEVLQSTVQFIQPMLIQRGLSLELQCDSGIPGILGDASQIKQLLLNLLLNAMDVAPAGSTITARIRRGPDGELISEIQNWGEPIPPIHLPRVFDPFFTTRPHGTGLGLTVCKQIAEYHRGQMDVQSSVQSGTTFRFIVPPVEVLV